MTFALIVVGSLVCLVLTLSLAAGAKTAREERRGWRLRFTASDVRYEEKKDGDGWCGIFIEAIPRGHGIHGLRLKSATGWQSSPAWAANRKEEIVARVKKEWPGIHYYEGDEAQEPPPDAKPYLVMQSSVQNLGTEPERHLGGGVRTSQSRTTSATTRSALVKALK